MDLIERRAIESEIFSIPVISIKLINTSAPYYTLDITAGENSKPAIAIITAFNVISIANFNTDYSIYIIKESAPVNYKYYSTSYIEDNGYYGLSFISAAYEDKNKYFNCGKTKYWAKDCSKALQFLRFKNASKNVTINGIIRSQLIKDKSCAAFNHARDYIKNRRKRLSNPYVHIGLE